MSGSKAHETDMQEIHDTATELDIAVKTPSGAMGEKDQHSVKDGDHVDTNTTNSNEVCEPLDACSSKDITIPWDYSLDVFEFIFVSLK